jgi:hypothetical protein
MERTESKVVQAAPDYENEMIQEMQYFGWNLQGRQEMHEQGNAYGRPSITSDSYIVTTKVNKYVKLHFTRSLSMPNLTRVRELEQEYFGQQFPALPTLTVPGCFTLFGAAGVIICLAFINQHGAPGMSGVIMYIVWVALGFLWIRSRQGKRAASAAKREASLQRSAAIKKEVAGLV